MYNTGSLRCSRTSFNSPRTDFFVTSGQVALEPKRVVRGGDKLNKTVLDVGSSTGEFTDYALQHGARLVYSVGVGTEQLHPSFRGDERIELHEKTDICGFTPPDFETWAKRCFVIVD